MRVSLQKPHSTWQSPTKQNGAALLALVAIMLMSITIITVTSLSINKLRAQKNTSDLALLKHTRDALIGYALTQVVPGTLPCPDTNGDGLENAVAGGCQSPRGLVPHLTLGIDEPLDSKGVRLWYGVEPAYTANANVTRNSSRASSITLNGNTVAAVIIAPLEAIGNQTRGNFNVAGYLEGVNADNVTTTFAQQLSDTNNDLVIAVDLSKYWSQVERRVLVEMGQLVRDYLSACGEYPWAAAYLTAPYDSVQNQKSGSFPSAIALPTDWNTACANTISPPSWFTTHWADQIYFSMCEQSEGACITIQGDSNSTADAVLIGPGIPLVGQSRVAGAQNDYFELTNATSRPLCVPAGPGSCPATPAFTFLKLSNHSAAFNDVLYRVGP